MDVKETEGYVRHYFESQRPMTEEEKHGYWQRQIEQYQSRLFWMTPVINMSKVLETMITNEPGLNTEE